MPPPIKVSGGKRFKIVLLATVIVAGVVLFLVIDWDRDGLATLTEFRGGTSVFNSDTDGDGLKDGLEVNTHGTNPSVSDSDDDGLNDYQEVNHGTNPFVTDSDGDGLSDGIEVNGWSITVDGLPRYVTSNPLSGDTDEDDLSDRDEHDVYSTDPRSSDTDEDDFSDESEISTYGTNPLAKDTDGDGLNDKPEVNTYGTSPLSADTDNDNLNDGLEVKTYGTDPLVMDTDGDGLNDGAEVNIHKTSPTDTDTDWDSGRILTLDDYQEVYIYGTNPVVSDTDGDGLIDGEEVEVGTDPLGTNTDEDPTYSEMLDFLGRDKTDEKKYIEDVYMCYHFAAEVGRNADSEGIRSAYVHIDFQDGAHAIVAFDTVDRGLIFIEPQNDEEMKVEIGKPYWSRDKYLPPDYDDTVVDFEVFW